MQEINEEISRLFKSYSEEPITNLGKIPQSGSNRIYFRLTTDKRSYIATYGSNLKENLTFILFSRHFAS
ncbi:MAG TPA: hypothetical protein VFV08_00175, partial [Puia sp.]|nr:hypothetical protein [Puia sp.]